MNFAALTAMYLVNRPLNADEAAHHLSQYRPSPSQPLYQLSVIKMNSTYLECTDKFFGDKGYITATALCMVPLFIMALILKPLSIILEWPSYSETTQQWSFVLLAVLYGLFVPIFLFYYWILRKETFRYTHYPIRFNRKTRMVHAFQLDGTIMTAPWDKLYFTVGRGMNYSCEILGHRLAEDGITVLETFALPFRSVISSPYLYSQWEFVRRYMEDGPHNLVGQVEHVMDIAEKREKFLNGLYRLMAIFGAIPILAYLFLPLLLVFATGRWLAMLTGKIPVWPAEIEAQSKIEPGDPYIRDAKHRPSITRPVNNDALEKGTAHSRIADKYFQQGDYIKALKWYQKALAIREQFLGAEHPDTASTYSDIALVFDAQGEHAKALEWLQKVLEIAEKVLGKEHPDTAATHHNIAFVHSHQGNDEKALPEFLKAYRIMSHKFGAANPQTKEIRANLENTYNHLNKNIPFAEWLAQEHVND
jgi:tetratricopeptide (TPR) repeat protein